jgi:hypothetical protein
VLKRTPLRKSARRLLCHRGRLAAPESSGLSQERASLNTGSDVAEARSGAEPRRTMSTIALTRSKVSGVSTARWFVTRSRFAVKDLPGA